MSKLKKKVKNMVHTAVSSLNVCLRESKAFIVDVERCNLYRGGALELFTSFVVHADVVWRCPTQFTCRQPAKFKNYKKTILIRFQKIFCWISFSSFVVRI